MIHLIKRFQKFWEMLLFSTLVLLTLTFWSNKTIVNASENYITDDVEKLDSSKVGLLLGTSKNLKSGRKNDFFYYRMQPLTSIMRVKSNTSS